MKMIAVGDNVTDCYYHQKTYYPGGNAVNVAVGCKRTGLFDEVAYIGVFGTDENAAHIKYALTQEGITFDRSRTVEARSGRPGVTLGDDGDRIFLGGPQDTAQHIVRLRLTKEDLEYISRFDVCHTSCFSNIEPELENLKSVVDVAFDFSDFNDREYLKPRCPYLRYAFFSGSDLTDAEVQQLIDDVHAMGTEIVGVTLGKRGACFSRNGQRYLQGIKPSPKPVVDTMGAGDSFIAGFLSEFNRTGDMAAALDFAAGCSAETVTISGGFGYPHPFDPEND